MLNGKSILFDYLNQLQNPLDFETLHKCRAISIHFSEYRLVGEQVSVHSSSFFQNQICWKKGSIKFGIETLY